jgi:hypothetical protein
MTAQSALSIAPGSFAARLIESRITPGRKSKRVEACNHARKGGKCARGGGKRQACAMRVGREGSKRAREGRARAGRRRACVSCGDAVQMLGGGASRTHAPKDEARAKRRASGSNCAKMRQTRLRRQACTTWKAHACAGGLHVCAIKAQTAERKRACSKHAWEGGTHARDGGKRARGSHALERTAYDPMHDARQPPGRDSTHARSDAPRPKGNENQRLPCVITEKNNTAMEPLIGNALSARGACVAQRCREPDVAAHGRARNMHDMRGNMQQHAVDNPR